MATIEKRASGRYRVMIRRRGHRLDRTFDSRRAARDWAVEVEGKILAGDIVDLGEARRTTLGEALERYRDEVTHTKRGAAQERIRIGQWLADPLASRTLVGVRSTDIAAWRSRMVERGYAPTTIRNALTIISQVYKTAASEWGMPELRNPVRGVRLPKHRPGRDRRLEPGEEEALLSAAMRSGCPWLLPAIVISLETAMRRGELLSLRWEDVMPDRVLIRTTKNGRPRVVALSSRARAALAEMPRSLGGNVVPLSGSAGSGRVFPITAPALDHRWRTARELAGVEDLHWHDLRHEAVSRLFERGLSTEEVMTMSGHTTYAMLARYTHLRASNLAARLG